MPHQLRCLGCERPLPLRVLDGALTACEICSAKVQVTPFPALVRDLRQGAKAEQLLSDEASCFYHETQRADIACDGCGRFLCSLCDLEIEEEHLCSNCLSYGRTEGKLEEVKNSHFCADQLIMLTAALPLLMFPITVFTAPLTLGMLIYFRKSPESPIRGGGTRRRWMAGTLAVLQLLFWGLFILGIGTASALGGW